MNSPAFDNYITLLKQQPRQNIEMICYKDRTWCSESFHCANIECDKNLSHQEVNDAVKLWGGLDFPVSYKYCRTENCGYVSRKPESIDKEKEVTDE